MHHAPRNTIELAKEDMKFSAAHFTIFSGTERELVHGHDFRVAAELTIAVPEDGNGMAADYKHLKSKLRELCRQLDEKFLIPSFSPYLSCTPDGSMMHIVHGQDQMLLPAKDIEELPITNTTVEELARLLCDRFCEDQELLRGSGVLGVTIKVSSGNGQWAGYRRDEIRSKSSE
jgi:6-pyruvoyltetrahydropterin/6-carboxytetrahydropterin synthase